MRKKILVMFIVILILVLLSACDKAPEDLRIPVPDESQVVIDRVTIEQIEERAKTLESKYGGPLYVLEYEDMYMILVAANYEYLSEEERIECNKSGLDIGKCMKYVKYSYFNWDFVYGVNRRGNESGYYSCPRLAELFFDDDLIAQAEFVDRQLYNYVYEQDEYAMYNISSYVWAEAHPLTTEYAPFHYEGEVMSSGAGYFINSVSVEFYNQVIDENESDKLDGYMMGGRVWCDRPDTAKLFRVKD